MKKWLKVLRIVLALLAFVTLNVAALWLPRKFGVDWLVGWPGFLGEMLHYALSILVSVLIWPRKKPKEKPAQTMKQKILASISRVIIFILLVGLLSGATRFFSPWPGWMTDRYEHSPSGKSKAIVLITAKEEEIVPTEYIYPVRAWFFYEDNNCIRMDPYFEDITLTWLDDNTLEITRIEKDTGEVSTDYLRW